MIIVTLFRAEPEDKLQGRATLAYAEKSLPSPPILTLGPILYVEVVSNTGEKADPTVTVLVDPS